MKKISLRGISEVLSEKEMKNVMGGSGNVAVAGMSCEYISNDLTSYCDSRLCIIYYGDRSGGCFSNFPGMGCYCVVLPN